MCIGGGGATKVNIPKPDPLPPPLPPPPPPKAPKPMAKNLVEDKQKPDIRIGQAKKQSTRARDRSTQTGGKQSLSIGDNQGLKL